MPDWNTASTCLFHAQQRQKPCQLVQGRALDLLQTICRTRALLGPYLAHENTALVGQRDMWMETKTPYALARFFIQRETFWLWCSSGILCKSCRLLHSAFEREDLKK